MVGHTDSCCAKVLGSYNFKYPLNIRLIAQLLQVMVWSQISKFLSSLLKPCLPPYTISNLPNTFAQYSNQCAVHKHKWGHHWPKQWVKLLFTLHKTDFLLPLQRSHSLQFNGHSAWVFKCLDEFLSSNPCENCARAVPQFFGRVCKVMLNSQLK